MRPPLSFISELSDGFVPNVDAVCKVGDPMKVLVIGIDEQDRVKLSRKRALEELGIEDDLQFENEGPSPAGERSERSDRGDDRGRYQDGGRRRSSGGPCGGGDRGSRR